MAGSDPLLPHHYYTHYIKKAATYTGILFMVLIAQLQWMHFTFLFIFSYKSKIVCDDIAGHHRQFQMLHQQL